MLQPRDLLKRLPVLLARPFGLLPHSMQRAMLEDFLQLMIRGAVEEGEFDFLEGRWLQIEIRDCRLQWCITLSSWHSLIVGRDVVPDVSISGNLRDFADLALQDEDPDTLFFQRRLVIQGDTELGLAVKNVISGLDMEPAADFLKSWVRRGIRIADRLPF